MTRHEYAQLSRVRRALVGLPGNYQLALAMFDRVLAEANDAFYVEDCYNDEMEKMSNGPDLN